MIRVYWKELLELTRDKKTLMFTILLPTLLMPVIMVGFSALVIMIDNKAKNEVLKYGISGAEYYPEVAEAIAANEKFELVELSADISKEDAITDDKIRFFVELKEDTQSLLELGKSAEVNIHYNDSSSTSAKVIKRVEKSIEEVKNALAEMRVSNLGLSNDQKEGLIEPIKIVEMSTADDRESFGERIGGMLPYILIILGLAGAMYPAIDLGVGEKERGTLETLLLTPVPRFQLVFAKFLVIFTTSFLSIFFSLISFALIITLSGPMLMASVADGGGEGLNRLIEAMSAISLLDVFLIFLMLTPVCAVFGSVLLAVSIYARTFKEAQNYMSPITMFAILPVILALLPGVKLNWMWAMVPLTNVALAIKEIFKGTIEYGMLFVILASTTIVAGLLLSLCSWWFQREQVLFRN